MRKTAKILCCLLALVMLLPLAIACKKDTPGTSDSSSDSQSQGDTTKPKETDKWGQEVIDNTALRELDFNGKTVHIVSRDGEQYAREWKKDTPEDALDQEVYYRNLAIESEINVKLDIQMIKNSDYDNNLTNYIKNAAQAGNGSIDIVSHYAALASATTLLPYYKNWYSEDLKWLNLENPYWNQNFIDAATAFDRLFLCVGDVNLSVYDRAIVVFFNRALAENEYKDRVGDLYQTVLDYEWTAEVMYTMIKDLHENNGTPEDTSDDVYGLASIKGSEASDGFIYSWNCLMTETKADGTHQLVTETARTKLSNAFDQMCKIWYQSNGATLLKDSGVNYQFFTQGHALFDIDVLYHYKSGKTMLNEMKDGFGIVPVPMYDEDQKDIGYLTGVQDAHNVMSIVNNGIKSDFEMISAVLELLCAENYESVRPNYIETTVKTQFLDAKSAKCLELVMDGTKWDFADVYSVGLGSVRNAIWRSPFQKYEQGSTFTTAIETNGSTLNGNMADFDAWLATQY